MAIINGTHSDDSRDFGGTDLVGTGENDDIFGFAGNDKLIGGLGNDFLIGDAGNDAIFGDEGNDYLRGGTGNDTLRAGDGNNVLNGGAGNDTLTGGAGHNVLTGGTGDDAYDILDGNTNVVIEFVNGGIDSIFVRTASFTLPANVENLFLVRTNTSGSSDMTGNGNALNNIVVGDFGSDILSGLAGNDSLNGNVGDDILLGGDGDDILIGGQDNDRLLGGEGDDLFRFFFPLHDVDTIADFVAADDSIQVAATSFGGGLTAGQAISAGQFRLGTSAVDTSDRFIYNNNGKLFFDSDGIGGAAQVQLATLIGVPTIRAADIIVI
jgi:Ca2+-binding RTX toxin-like protein